MWVSNLANWVSTKGTLSGRSQLRQQVQESSLALLHPQLEQKDLSNAQTHSVISSNLTTPKGFFISPAYRLGSIAPFLKLFSIALTLNNSQEKFLTAAGFDHETTALTTRPPQWPPKWPRNNWIGWWDLAVLDGCRQSGLSVMLGAPLAHVRQDLIRMMDDEVDPVTDLWRELYQLLLKSCKDFN